MSQEKFTTSWRRLIPFFLGGLGVILMVAGILINYFQSNQNITTRSVEKTGVATVAGSLTSLKIQVDVSGAVEKPGVYELPYNSRVKDVLIAAGGLTAKADRNYLSKNINLAQRVNDGQKVYFPETGEQQLTNISNSSNLNDINRLININTGSEAELDSLPGIGPVTAGKIIAGRPYQNIAELISRKIVTKSVYNKIKEKITTN